MAILGEQQHEDIILEGYIAAIHIVQQVVVVLNVVGLLGVHTLERMVTDLFYAVNEVLHIHVILVGFPWRVIQGIIFLNEGYHALAVYLLAARCLF